MTDLRDARLAKALAHAPDADDVPSAATRGAIRKIAERPINTWANRPKDQEVPWWKALWAQSGRRAGNWQAAFATVVLGGIITLLWHGRELPDEKPEKSVAQAPSPASVPATVSTAEKPPGKATDVATAGAAVTGMTPSPATATATAAKQSRPAQNPKDAQNAKNVENSQVAAAPVAEPTVPAPAQAAPEAAAVANADKAMRDAAPATQRAATGAVQAPVAAPAPTAAAAPAPMPKALPQAELAGRSAATGAAAGTGALGRLAAPSLREWTSADLTYGGRSTRLARPQGQALVSRIQSLTAAMASDAPNAAEGASLLRLQLLDANGVQATFELWANSYRWQKAGQRDVLGPVNADDVSSLLALAAQAMPP
jgi:hypothetical protein